MVLGVLFSEAEGAFAASMRTLVAAAGWDYVMAMEISALFSLSFFIASFVRKNPQMQFFIEFIIAVCIVIFSPVY